MNHQDGRSSVPFPIRREKQSILQSVSSTGCYTVTQASQGEDVKSTLRKGRGKERRKQRREEEESKEKKKGGRGGKNEQRVEKRERRREGGRERKRKEMEGHGREGTDQKGKRERKKESRLEAFSLLYLSNIKMYTFHRSVGQWTRALLLCMFSTLDQ